MISGLLSAVAIIYAIRHTAMPKERHHQRIRITVRPLLRGPLGRLMIAVTAFEIGNCAMTLLILRASQLFTAGHGKTAATQLALLLYIGYNIAAALISVPAGRHGDRYHPVRRGGVLRCRLRLVRRGQPSAHRAAARVPARRAGHRLRGNRSERRRCQPRAGQLRGSAFGLLATVQSAGNLIASSVTGLLWTAASPTAAFIFLASAMLLAAVLTTTTFRRDGPSDP